MYESEKREFSDALKDFSAKLESHIARDGEWTIRGFIDIFRNVYPVSTDTKVISKVLELHLFPLFLSFAEANGYHMEPASRQNWYPDLSFVHKENADIKFAVDLKTTFRDEKRPDFCNGFTLGSHGEYFIRRESGKNIQYPYGQYSGHFCVGMIYSRNRTLPPEETMVYSVNEIESIPAAVRNFIFFAEEKWKIASDKSGSGNTANIGSVRKIEDIITGNGVFAKAGEAFFDDYWANFGLLQIPTGQGGYKKLSSFAEYLAYRGLPEEWNNAGVSGRRKIHPT